MIPLASDLSYRVLQERRRRGELTTPQAYHGGQLPQAAGVVPVIREAVASAEPVGVDLETWERTRLNRRVEG